MQTEKKVYVESSDSAQISTTNVNKPVKRFRAGPISATIWENEAIEKQSTYFTISLDRAYKDADGAWQHTGSFRVNDLPKASLVLEKAYEWISLSRE